MDKWQRPGFAKLIVCSAYKYFNHGSSKGAECMVLHVNYSSGENEWAEQKQCRYSPRSVMRCSLGTSFAYREVRGSASGLNIGEV